MMCPLAWSCGTAALAVCFSEVPNLRSLQVRDPYSLDDSFGSCLSNPGAIPAMTRDVGDLRPSPPSPSHPSQASQIGVHLRGICLG